MGEGMDIVLSPLVGFFFFVLVSLGLYRLGSAMAPKLRDVGGKLAQYACGEAVPAKSFQVGYRLFFYAALFFSIMHVAALVVATVPAGVPILAVIGLVYLVMILLAIEALVLK